MKNPRLIVGGSSVLLLVASCGGHDHVTQSLPPPSGPVTQSLSTADVLAQARQPTETTEPYVVDDGALTLTDTSDETEPASVNGA
jgi:hypothetical protein